MLMHNPAFLAAAALLTITTISLATADEHSDHAGKQAYTLSEQGIYRVSFEASLQPIEINRMHEWVLHIEYENGDPVENAEITVEGGMPAHNHGMPTAPRVTEYLGDGNYRAQGMRFHMRGQWQITVTIDDGNKVDSAVIAMRL